MPSLVGLILMLVKLSLIQGRVRERFNRSLATLSVEKGLICANKGDSLTLSCTLAIHRTKRVFKNWTLSWHSEGIPLTNNVTESRENATHFTTHLRLDAVWSGERLFTCVASRFLNNAREFGAFNSTSLVKVKSPTRCDIIGFRFIEHPLSMPVGHSLEVYWKPLKFSRETMYTFNFCAEPEMLFDEVIHVCPRYSSINSSCFYRDKDVYNVSNTKGFTCMASVTTYFGLNMYVPHRAYINSKAEGESCEYKCSTEQRFYLTYAHDPFPEPNITEVVLIPRPLASLRVLARVPREVTLIWSGASSANFITKMTKVRYKCSDDSIWNEKDWLTQTKLTLNSDSFQNYQPYDLCRFCVIARAFIPNGMDSEPLCEDIRLHEEPPSSAPKITCPGDECQTMRNEYERNMSITWTLPPRKDWNGVLTKVRIFYRSDHKKSFEVLLDSNNTEVHITSNATTGQALLTGLQANQTYWIRMVACNKEGCSEPGTEFEVVPLPPMTPYKKNSALNKPFVLVACTVSVFSIACLIFAAYVCVKKRRKLRPKLELNITEPSGYDFIVDGADKVEYDVLVVLDSTRYVDITRLDVYATRPSFV